MTPAAMSGPPELCALRDDVTMEIVEQYLHNLSPGPAGFRIHRLARLRALVPDADADYARRHTIALLRGRDGLGGVGAESPGDGISLEGVSGREGRDYKPGSRLPSGAPTREDHRLKGNTANCPFSAPPVVSTISNARYDRPNRKSLTAASGSWRAGHGRRASRSSHC